jgi:cobalamin synthase
LPHTAIDPAVLFHRHRRRRQVEAVLVFLALGILLISSNFHAWVLWPCLALVVVIVRMWVKRKFGHDG